MTIDIFMPALSPTMEHGSIAKWRVEEGEKIVSGDIIVEIETDKATMEVESVDDGTIVKIFSEEGTSDIPVGQVIAVMAEEGEEINAVNTAAPVQAEKAAPSKSQKKKRIKASPLAKRLANQAGVDIESIVGSGPQGRILKEDVEAAIAEDASAEIEVPDIKKDLAEVAVNTPAPEIPSVPAQPVMAVETNTPRREEKLSSMRKTIAKRLTQSKTTIPHFYLNIDCELDNLLSYRKELNDKLASENIKLSVNDFIVRAAGLALKKVPAANVQYAGDMLYRYERADISVAVAVDDGLITPIVHGACSKGLAEISTEIKDMAGRARAGTLKPEEYTGGTFSISNLGMHGIKDFSAVINPPQGAILSVGTGEQRPVVKDGALAVATVMSCTLSCDHRAIDGAVGAEFLAAFKAFIEDPLRMLL